MKKMFILLLSLMLTMSLAACDNNSGPIGNIPSPQPSTTPDSGNKMPESTAPEKTSSTVEGTSAQDTRIKLTFDGKEVTVKMYDNPTSRDLLAQLPLTLNFKDYASTEKIAYPPKALSTKDAPSGADPKVGDLALYSPWGDLVIYYGESGYANGLIILGHIESGVEKFADMDKEFTIKIEKIN